MGTLASRLFGMREPVSRELYLRAGLALATLKYAVDVAIVYAFSGALLTPLRYSAMSVSLALPDALRQTPMLLALALWALPFMWIGMSMTLRRCADANVGSGWAVLFFLPIVSYFLIATLCVLPTREAMRSEPAGFLGSRRKALLMGVMSGVAVLFSASVFSVFALESYGAMLFIGAPFVSGFVAAFALRRGWPRSTDREAIAVALSSVVTAGGALLLFALEGVFCLAMAMPLALLLSVLGALMGRAAAGGGLRASPVLVLLCVWPLLTAAESAHGPPPARELLSTIVVDRTPAEVWPHVVAFGEIAPPEEWYFRGGIAYPQRARIEHLGGSAIRYCEFSTGPFVEPITTWDPPRRLAFGVSAQPQPMSELSPYREVMAPHLEGNLRSERGEFLLIALAGGRTRIEARTWYSIDMFPQPYWRLWSDAIIHAIHMRVLRHIAVEAEAGVGATDPR